MPQNAQILPDSAVLSGPEEVMAGMGSDFVLLKAGEMSRRNSGGGEPWPLRPSETCRRSGEICRNMGPDAAGKCDGKCAFNFQWEKNKEKLQETMGFLAINEEKWQQKIARRQMENRSSIFSNGY